MLVGVFLYMRGVQYDLKHPTLEFFHQGFQKAVNSTPSSNHAHVVCVNFFPIGTGQEKASSLSSPYLSCFS